MSDRRKLAAVFVVVGLVGVLAVIVMRRRVVAVGNRALEAPLASYDPAAPVPIDPGPPLVIESPNVPALPAEPGVLAAVSTFLGDVVDSVKNLLTPRGIRNNNPGNIRTLPAGRAWRGQVGDDGGGYGVYQDMAHGVRAAGKQLLAYERRGLDTIREIITTWAPPSENVTRAYIAAVSSALRLEPDVRFSVDGRLEELAAAIFHHENGAPFTSFAIPGGGRNFSSDELRRWVRLP